MGVLDYQEERWSPVTIFYSYAHEDEKLRQQLETHLSGLRRQGLVSEWHDRQIVPGTEWAYAINEHLNTAQIILLLISPDFLASDYCYSVEMQRALERHNAGEAYVVPVILRPVDWQGAPFATFQALPRDGQPIVLWENEDEAFANVAEGVRKIVGEIYTASPVNRPDTLPLSLPWRTTPRVPLQPSHVLKDRNRQEVLKRIQRVVNQFLKQSLADTAFIQLGFSERPDAVENPWRLVYREMNRPAQSLPPETEILQVYDQANGELLILGEPGSGKTTLLWKLAGDLLKRAFADKIHPIPVVVQLSTWVDKRLPLAQWLVEALSLLYKVPRKLGQTWIEQNRLLILLDGLDEVNLKHRTACIRAINDYRKEHGLVPFVVCSRSAEYFAQAERIQLSSAVVIQPLTQKQIDSYVARAGERGSAISKALQSDSVLRELATTPLMLNLLMFTYQDSSAWEVADDVSPQERRDQIFARYVELVLVGRRGAQTPYTPQQTKKWLAWLARQLALHSQTAFYMERIQPDWLDGSRRRVLFRPLVWLGIALASSAFSTVLYGLIGGAIDLLSTGFTGFVGAWAFALIIGVLLGGVTGVLVSQVRQEISPAESVSWSWHDFWRHIAHTGLGAGILAGLLVAIFISLFLGLVAALQVSLPLAVIFGLLYQFVKDLPQTSPGRRSSARHLLWPVQGLLDSLCVGLITLGLLSWLRATLLTSFFAITFSLLSLIVTLDPARVQVQNTPAPSARGSSLSLRSRLRAGIAFGLAGALPTSLLVGISIGFVVGAVDGLSQGILVGRIIGSVVAVVCWWLFGLFFGLKSKRQVEGSLVCQVVLTWAGMWRQSLRSSALRNSAIFGVLCAAIIGLGGLLISGPFQAATDVFAFGLNGVIVGGVASILLNGFSTQMREEQTFGKPNQGIWYSLQNSIRVGLLFAVLGFCVELLLGVSLGVITGSSLVTAGFIFGILCGICGWLFNGGIACIQHVALRWLLWRAGFTPGAYVRFLDYATERMLLYKVGGSYIFIHRLLQEYFTSLSTSEETPGG